MRSAQVSAVSKFVLSVEYVEGGKRDMLEDYSAGQKPVTSEERSGKYCEI